MTRRDVRGFTLIEAMIAIGVFGILMLAGIPKAQQAVRRAQVRSARTAIANLYQQARARAITEGRNVTVNFDGNSVWMTAQPRRSAGFQPCGCDTVGMIRNLTAQYGVAVTATPGTFQVDARGLGVPSGASTRVVVVRSGTRDSVTISGYGRVTQ
ncbi:MAG TPA: GspH/FimT family pseudopilin [Gemmatimonadales bacterium]|nr:GspH/FimT family pseudopilin [Gemmatimonadales bacterium]